MMKKKYIKTEVEIIDVATDFALLDDSINVESQSPGGTPVVDMFGTETTPEDKEEYDEGL